VERVRSAGGGGAATYSASVSFLEDRKPSFRLLVATAMPLAAISEFTAASDTSMQLMTCEASS
jgi:hypothetical protein